MAKRDIGKEIIQGLEEIKAWKRGERKLRTATVDLPARRGCAGDPQTTWPLSGAIRQLHGRQRRYYGPARALLLVATKQPRAVRQAFKATVPTVRGKT